MQEMSRQRHLIPNPLWSQHCGKHSQPRTLCLCAKSAALQTKKPRLSSFKSFSLFHGPFLKFPNILMLFPIPGSINSWPCVRQGANTQTLHGSCFAVPPIKENINDCSLPFSYILEYFFLFPNVQQSNIELIFFNYGPVAGYYIKLWAH